MNTEKNKLIKNKKEVNNIHSLCSYLAMFKPKMPSKYIEKYTKKNDIVFDPFSGRGTTLLEARLLGRKSIGNDLSPLGYVLSRGKSDFVQYEEILNLIDKFEKEYLLWEKKNSIHLNQKIFRNIKYFYSKNNLKQIFWFREEIGKNYLKLNSNENFILFLALGLMHGQTRKNGDTMYFSVSMPNGYSMSPNYVKNYVKKNNLKYPKTNIFEQLKCRLKTRKDNIFFDVKTNGKVFNCNATDISKYFKKKQKIKLIFTSPPYLNVVRYVDQNWIRYWLLGFDNQYFKNIKLDDKHSKVNFSSFLFNFFKEMEKIMHFDTVFFLVIGDVKKINILEIIENELIKTKLKIEKIDEEEIKQSSKLSNQMGKNKVGKAVKKEYVIKIMKKRR